MHRVRGRSTRLSRIGEAASAIGDPEAQRALLAPQPHPPPAPAVPDDVGDEFTGDENRVSNAILAEAATLRCFGYGAADSKK